MFVNPFTVAHFNFFFFFFNTNFKPYSVILAYNFYNLLNVSFSSLAPSPQTKELTKCTPKLTHKTKQLYHIYY